MWVIGSSRGVKFKGAVCDCRGSAETGSKLVSIDGKDGYAKSPISVFRFKASPALPRAETLYSDALAALTTSYQIPATGATGKAADLPSVVELAGEFFVGEVKTGLEGIFEEAAIVRTQFALAELLV